MFGHSQFHRRFRNPFARREVSTIYEVVYTTAAPTFTGEIGGYLTLGVPANKAQSTTSTTPAVSQKAATSAAAAVANASGSQAQTPASSTAKQTTLSTSTLPASIESPSTTLGSSLGILAATGSLLSPGTTTKEYTSHTVSGSVPTATADASTSSATMSTGAKAGLVIGILLLIGAILSLILFCFKKRRDAAKHERLEDEKHEFENIQRRMSTRTTATTATAPRLSLRPVTQFLPNLTMKRSSRGNALGIAAEGGQQWETDRPSTTQSSQANDPENPFGNHATQLQANPHENPFGNHAETIPPASPPSPTSPIDATNARGAEIVDDVSVMDAVPPGTAVTAVAAAAPGLKRGASKRENAPAPMDFTRAGPFMGPPSPAGTEFSMSSEAGNGQASQTGTGAAIAAAGGPAHSAVHRVQLDFNPSMEDELELRAGQLIRLLHEYDDGWALCIRLDRSRQGVVPRTCLSTRPVKPRPQQNGPRVGHPGMRGPQMQRMPQAPMTADGRPMTPTGPLPSTPDGRSRSPSINHTHSRSNSPPGPSRMNPISYAASDASSHYSTAFDRKPVPGQAL